MLRDSHPNVSSIIRFVESKSMTIALVLPSLCDRFGGPVTVAKCTGRVLSDLGHSVSYWAAVANGDGYETAWAPSVHLYDVNWPRHWRRSSGLGQGLSSVIPKTHIVQTQSVWMYSSYAAGRIACASGVPYIIRPAGTLQPWAMENGRLKRLKKAAYLRLIAKPLMDRAACVQAASIQEAEQLCKLRYKGPVTVIPNGVDIQYFSPGDRREAEDYWPVLSNRPVVVFMSRLSPEKGLDMLIPVWADLVQSGMSRNGVLVVAGPDDRGYQRTVKGMVGEHGLGQHVFMPGMVQGPKKLALLRRADVFILPSYSENFGIVVAEAMACGAPVIATTCTPWEQLQHVDAGRWVPPTQEAIAQALGELLGMSESHRRQMGARGVALVREQYTWDQAARKFLTVCACILQARPIPLYPEPKDLKRA